MNIGIIVIGRVGVPPRDRRHRRHRVIALIGEASESGDPVIG